MQARLHQVKHKHTNAADDTDDQGCSSLPKEPSLQDWVNAHNWETTFHFPKSECLHSETTFMADAKMS